MLWKCGINTCYGRQQTEGVILYSFVLHVLFSCIIFSVMQEWLAVTIHMSVSGVLSIE